MRGVITKIILAVFVIGTGCTIGTRDRYVYSGTIVRVRDNPGEFYSPDKGRKPLVSIYITVQSPRPGIASGTFEILLLDNYLPEVYGRTGDKVSFGYVGALPANGKISFESVSNYRIVARGG